MNSYFLIINHFLKNTSLKLFLILTSGLVFPGLGLCDSSMKVRGTCRFINLFERSEVLRQMDELISANKQSSQYTIQKKTHQINQMEQQRRHQYSSRGGRRYNIYNQQGINTQIARLKQEIQHIHGKEQSRGANCPLNSVGHQMSPFVQIFMEKWDENCRHKTFQKFCGTPEANSFYANVQECARETTSSGICQNYKKSYTEYSCLYRRASQSNDRCEAKVFETIASPSCKRRNFFPSLLTESFRQLSAQSGRNISTHCTSQQIEGVKNQLVDSVRGRVEELCSTFKSMLKRKGLESRWEARRKKMETQIRNISSQGQSCSSQNFSQGRKTFNSPRSPNENLN